MNRYCYWVSWQRETRISEKPRLVKVEGLGRWIQVWMTEFKQEHVGCLIVQGWASKFWGVPFSDVQVIRMQTFDRVTETTSDQEVLTPLHPGYRYAQHPKR